MFGACAPSRRALRCRRRRQFARRTRGRRDRAAELKWRCPWFQGAAAAAESARGARLACGPDQAPAMTCSARLGGPPPTMPTAPAIPAKPVDHAAGVDRAGTAPEAELPALRCRAEARCGRQCAGGGRDVTTRGRAGSPAPRAEARCGRQCAVRRSGVASRGRAGSPAPRAEAHRGRRCAFACRDSVTRVRAVSPRPRAQARPTRKPAYRRGRRAARGRACSTTAEKKPVEAAPTAPQAEVQAHPSTAPAPPLPQRAPRFETAALPPGNIGAEADCIEQRPRRRAAGRGALRARPRQARYGR